MREKAEREVSAEKSARSLIRARRPEEKEKQAEKVEEQGRHAQVVWSLGWRSSCSQLEEAARVSPKVRESVQWRRVKKSLGERVCKCIALFGVWHNSCSHEGARSKGKVFPIVR